MAVEIGTISGTSKESVARFCVYTDAALSPLDWRIDIHFETADYDAKGKLALDQNGNPKPTQFGSRVVSLRFGDVKDDDIGGMTIAAIAAKIQQACYVYRQQQIDAAIAAKAAFDKAAAAQAAPA